MTSTNIAICSVSIAFFLIVVASCVQSKEKSINATSSDQTEKKNFKEQIKFTAEADKWDTTNNANNLLIKCHLTNTSSDTFSYVVMTCFSERYIVQPEGIFSSNWLGCDGNFATTITIPPKSTFEEVLPLPIKKNLNIDIKSFRIGTYLMASSSSKQRAILLFQYENNYTSLTDTIYRVKTKFTIIKYREIAEIDSLSEVHLLWSNQIKF